MSKRRSVLVLALLTASCSRSSAPVAVRLVDLYKASNLASPTAGRVAPVPRTEWRFDGPIGEADAPLRATFGWDGRGVRGLSVKEGRLEGVATTGNPLLRVERKPVADDRDLVHEVQVRLRVSAGTQLAVEFRDGEKVDLDKEAKDAPDPIEALTSPLVPGSAARTYAIRPRWGIPASSIRHVLLRPSNVKDARFEVESVRIVLRREHLAEIPSGVSWQGLSEIYRESITMRSAESALLRVPVPSRPRLELGLGTLEEGPLTFRVAVRASRESSAKDEVVVLERTVTTPHHWEQVAVDLSRFAGREVGLSLSLASDSPGRLGLWGSPAVRSLGAMPPAVGSGRGSAKRPQGVIVVWTDTMRRDHLGVYGYARPTSPVIDQLAAEGTLFKDAVVQATWTKVSTPSLLSSLYPTSHGVADFSDRLPSSATTLAEVFRQAGYATTCYSSVIFVGKFTNLHQGFEELHEQTSLPDQNNSKTSRDYVDRLLPWLEAHREVPFFVLLHITDPHDPYKPRPPYDTLFADPARASEHTRQEKEVEKFISDPMSRRFMIPTREELVSAKIDPEGFVGYNRDLYDGSIRGMDAEIGRLKQRLSDLGLRDKTLMVFTGDHGEEFLEHGRTFHGQTTYGELGNVPLILWGAGVPKGAVVEDTVRDIDLYPTLLEMSGLAIPREAQGRSLVPLLGRSPTDAKHDEPAITEKAETHEVGGAPPPRDTESVAIVWGGFKLIHNLKRPRGGPEFELFDHGKDPLDRTDLAAKHPEIVDRLAKELAAWRKMAEAARLKPDTEAAASLKSEDLERLRALGYIQ